MSEWADRYRVLDPMFSNEAGQFVSDRTPYAREWMDSASLRWVRRITLMASTQVGKSETLNNVAGYFIHQQPCPIMFVVPRGDDAKLAANRRIRPMVLASPALRSEMTTRLHDVKSREMVFRRSILYFRAAQSPADLAGVPVRVVLADECDKWPHWTGKEASPLDLVMERTRTFRDYLIALCSTPTTRSGIIAREFEEGDQRRFWVACPHCAKWQVLRFANVKWSAEVRTAKQMRRERAAWYECDHCSGKIDDAAKNRIVREGVWVPAHSTVERWTGGEREADRADHRSYHVWAGYSPWVQWWEVAAKFLASKGEPARMMNFVNSWLAELWEERVDETTDSAVAASIDSEHTAWKVPASSLVITASVDVQKDYMRWAVFAWGRDEESWLVAEGETDSWRTLGDILFRNPWGEAKLNVRCCVIDSRHRRDEVIDFVRQWHPVARMIAGVERDSPIPFGTVKLDKHPRTGAALPNAMIVWTVNVAFFKDLVAARFAKAKQKELRAGRIHLPADLREEFATELVAEHKVRERSRNKERLRWVLKPGHQRNEGWDLTVYAAAAARMIRVDTLRTPPEEPEPAPVRQPTRPLPPSRSPTRRPMFPRLGT